MPRKKGRKQQMVKCRFCSRQIEKDIAYAVKHGKVNYYYCNYEHSIAKSPRDIFYDKAMDVFGRTTNTVFYKEFDEIAKVHGFEKMTAYLEENKGYLEKVMAKDFFNEFGRCRYFSAIFKNNLADYIMKKPEPVKVVSNVDIDFTGSKYKKKEEKKGMDSLLDELLD